MAKSVSAKRRTIRLLLGNRLKVLKTLPDNSVDAVVTDPPAGIKFMGEEWDTFHVRNMAKEPSRGKRLTGGGNPTVETGFAKGITGLDYSSSGRKAFVAFLSEAMSECLRVTKPGGRALVWAIPRTSHWTGTALEKAGWEIEDVVTHLFGTGFPKADSKLKPAAEFWWLCRKPGPKVLPLQIDATRVGTNAGWSYPNGRGGKGCFDRAGLSRNLDTPMKATAGRYPANLVLSRLETCRKVGTKKVKGSQLDQFIDRSKSDSPSIGKQTGSYCVGHTDANGLETVDSWECDPECPVFLLDQQSGNLSSVLRRRNYDSGTTGYGGMGGQSSPENTYGDSGGASRFFYCSKADTSERWFWCPDCKGAFPSGKKSRHQHDHRRPDGKADWSHLVWHPTVKSLDLMSWLVRLVTPPGGTVLDPFMGSGSTLVACVRGFCDGVGIDKEPAYHAIAARRVKRAIGLLSYDLVTE